MNELPKRKPNRLKDFDYSQKGAYFITICSDNKKCIFSKITPNVNLQVNNEIVGQGLAPAEVRLTKYGKIAEEQLLLLKNRYSQIDINKFVIMPNHIHIILTIHNNAAGASPCPTVSDIICTYKSLTTRMCKMVGYPNQKLFQRSFYDHIIRDEEDYITKAEYIENNPAKWQEDKYYVKKTPE